MELDGSIGAAEAAGEKMTAAGLNTGFDDALASFDNAAPAATPMSDAAPASGLGDIQNLLQDLMREIEEMFAELIQALQGGSNGAPTADKPGGASIPDSKGNVGPVPVDPNSNFGVPQGPSERIPDPSQHLQQIQLGGKQVTVGSDGSASAGEVAKAASEMERMYNESPTFKQTIDSAQTNDLTMTLGRRSDNTSWGGGGRVFLNLNNVTPQGDTFEELMGHEWGHAAAGMGHGSALESLEGRVRQEA